MKRFCFLFLASALAATPAFAFTLIKTEEAKLPAGAGVLATRGIARGPGIKLVSPEPGKPVMSPFTLSVQFEARGGVKIDPAATHITYLKSPPVDLLPRVKSGLSDKGIALEGAEAPPGEHQIMISIQDADGRVTNSVIQLTVVSQP